jgi:Flp pilus assembly pilin Flp
MRISAMVERSRGPAAEPAADGQLPAKSTQGSARRRKRRGATAMEYLVALSFILIVLIMAVQHLGKTTNDLLTNSATATTPK